MINITDDNVSKFNKRLQKALQEVLGQNVPLSQCAEIMAKASGFKTLHNLQQHLKPTEHINATNVIAPELQFAHEWFSSMEQRMTKYIRDNPSSGIQHMSWANYDGHCCLNILTHDGGFGLYFNENILHTLEKNMNEFDEFIVKDRQFIIQLAQNFPSDPLKSNLLSFYITNHKTISTDQHWMIVKNPHYCGHAMEGCTQERFAWIDPIVLTVLLEKARNNIDLNGVTPIEMFDTFEQAASSSNNCVVQWLDTPQGPKATFFGVWEDKVLKLYGVHDTNGFGVSDPDYDLVRFRGFLAANKKLTPQHNPYGINEMEKALWRDGFEYYRTQPFRNNFWIKK